MEERDRTLNAIHAARMYYYQSLTTEAIAQEMGISRSSVSRLLAYAKENGLVTIQVIDVEDQPTSLGRTIQSHYKEAKKVHVVPVSHILSESDWLERTAQYAANYLNTIFDSDMIMGVAWGTTLSAISRYLQPKTTHDSHIVQLNGAGNTRTMGIEYASEIILRFADAYQASVDLFPVPTFFDYFSTKEAMWKERSIKRILELQARADLLLHSIGAVRSGVPSHVYSGGFLEEKDYQELRRLDIAGDIATVFFRRDGSFHNIPINQRASGPNLELIKQKRAICVVSGLGKAAGLHAALSGGLVKELIVDEPTARLLVNKYITREKDKYLDEKYYI
jgi:DNA-binding transcriptional regulator LsrR (DeoR family)